MATMANTMANNHQNHHTQVSPFVLWGQSGNNVTLKIELRSVESPNVELDENKIRFQAVGIGQQGANDYQFELDFYDAIDPVKSVFKVEENCVDFLIRKQKNEIWPRLTLNKLRRAWLKVNFEKSHWNEVDDEQEPFGKAKNEELDFYLRNDVSKIGDRTLFEKREPPEPNVPDLIRRPISNVEFMRRFYLVLYNLIQIYGSVYLLTGLLLRYDGSNSFLTACRDMQSTINFLCFIRLFEIPHQMFGFVFGKDRTVWHTVLNRIFMFCVLIEFEPRLLIKPVVFYLVLLYATYDLVNYVHYTLRVLELDVYVFKWLKCTVWIVIYPLIFLCEAVILLRSVPYYGETKRLTLELPNALNFSFPFLLALRIHLFFVFTPLMFFTMNNLYKHRIKSLCSEGRGERGAKRKSQ